MSHRQRDLQLHAGTSILDTVIGSNTYHNEYPFSVVGRQSTDDDETAWGLFQQVKRENRTKSNPNPYLLNLMKSWDLGGNFATYRNSYVYEGDSIPPHTYITSYGPNTYYFGGRLYAHDGSNIGPDSSLWPRVPASEYETMFGVGSEAIKRCSPANPTASLAQFLGELRNDGLPHILGSSLIAERVLSFRNLGHEYLNVEFGWKPFVSDLRKLLHSVSSSHEILAQYERDSGRLIRRRYSFPILRTVEVQELGNRTPAPALDTPVYQSYAGPRRLLLSTEKEYSFAGAFTYYLSRGSRRFSKMEEYTQKANHLLGLEITPETLYQLEPWTWLVDWIVNFGSVLTNVSQMATDGLVMKYGYVMSHWKQEAAYEQLDVGLVGRSNPRTIITRSVFKTETKLRRKASPFGFGLDPATDFTSRQWAILGALGLTKAPRALAH